MAQLFLRDDSILSCVRERKAVIVDIDSTVMSCDQRGLRSVLDKRRPVSAEGLARPVLLGTVGAGW
jgi:hypothetical protein